MIRTFITIFAMVSNLVLADAVAKELAVAHLKGAAAVSIVPGFFNLAYVENRGCAWGLLQNRVELLAIFGVVALGLIIWRRSDFFGVAEKGWRKVTGRLAEWFLYAGIIGNLIDRVCRGYVIDFLDFYWGIHHFPCFNLADAYITIAVILLILMSFGTRPKNEKA